MSDDRAPAERIRAFGVAVDEEILRPLRRYVRGYRRGLVVGIVLALLLTPVAGSEVRGRLLGVAGFAIRCRRRRLTKG